MWCEQKCCQENGKENIAKHLFLRTYNMLAYNRPEVFIPWMTIGGYTSAQEHISKSWLVSNTHCQGVYVGIIVIDFNSDFEFCFLFFMSLLSVFDVRNYFVLWCVGFLMPVSVCISIVCFDVALSQSQGLLHAQWRNLEKLEYLESTNHNSLLLSLSSGVS